MTGANLGIQSYSIAISIILLLCNGLGRGGKISRIMDQMLWSNIALLSCYVSTILLEGHPNLEILDTVLTCGKCGLAYLIALFYTNYIVCTVGRKGRASALIVRIAIGACVVAMALNVLSIFNGMYFSCHGGFYARGPYFMLNQSIAALVLILDALLIYLNRTYVDGRTAFSLLSYSLLPVIAVFVQIPNPAFDTMGVATTLSLLIVYVTVNIERDRQLATKERELTESRMAVMLSQIQPHFLYNTLAVIQDMCHGKAPEAEQTTIEFSEFLRGNLDSLGQSEPIPFEQELRHTKNYLSLEKRRFGDMLNVEYDIGTTSFRVPALTLQPIVENAVRYGVMQREDGGTVWISTIETQSGYVITVTDNGVGFSVTTPKSDGRTHIGISNVKSRLETMCRGSLSINSVAGKGTVAVISIPKEEA